ncbi:MAG: 30S ribosomal protein S20 [Bacillota bacterium]|nr:MAG: 30S ribosomal protein S20 [Bacillota bacterium]
MPNIKSAKKRVLVIEKKSMQNKMIRSSVKTEIKKIDTLIKEGKVNEARVLLPEVFGCIDSAVLKGVLHRNNAANKKSRISLRIDAAEKNAPVAEEVAAPVVEEPVAEVVAEEAPKKRTRKPKAE